MRSFSGSDAPPNRLDMKSLKKKYKKVKMECELLKKERDKNEDTTGHYRRKADFRKRKLEDLREELDYYKKQKHTRDYDDKDYFY